MRTNRLTILVITIIWAAGETERGGGGGAHCGGAGRVTSDRQAVGRSVVLNWPAGGSGSRSRSQ